ncbi:MAG: monothiol glutaredoxin, Grx4 family [Deltaproteobacteria bacterium RIFCSPLOWO2_12_FULL_40_28]|nr:MAG: monothiol glutaredoxin, Grx4 family [Deltaproteobacteria bacterium RIFCSPHIGHO2_02_FULL_40_28]OGQ18893.1 MAG: monothiol glutaredoxin, Grx4 family [Deltaproteobacteria bacterium RIFCSPHIGHO2_12_FULL_40_32]OGQ40138.1 MAG: monothiol glutaredoxin, Grx4 family [Deltaproteobacteria bacterium RIFCSPLOWO2_02_FULL_40_36]OGQ53321.1 MAG: monothiol glutaredoxin, Grx4 family [Deltaproteobacteria bacterium RIFCSPLOWO2_12_FULL_40_28]
MSDVQSTIQKIIKENPVVVFMKGTPESPQCGFSAQTIHCFQAVGAPVKGVNVLADPAIRQGIKDLTQWPTIPQIFIKGEFIGGCDIVTEMYERGELKTKVGEALAK